MDEQTRPADEPEQDPNEIPELVAPESASFLPFDFRDADPPAEPQAGMGEPSEYVPGLARVGRAARRRHARRSWIVMLLCLAVLAAAVVLAGRF